MNDRPPVPFEEKITPTVSVDAEKPTDTPPQLSLGSGDVAEASEADETMGRALARHAGQTDWKHRELVADLYDWFDRFNGAFFGGRLPAAVISVERTNRRNLGWYKPWRDGLALKHRVNLNVTFAYRDPADRLETLLHEMVHLEQDVDGFYKTQRRRYHDKKFQVRARALGIPTSPRGYSLGIVADGPFAKLLTKHDVKVVKPATTEDSPALAAASRATSASWSCGCTKAWVAKGRTLHATCDACGQAFERGERGGAT